VAKQAFKVGSEQNGIIIRRPGNRNRAVIWVGPPLSGKDTQTERFEKLGFPVLKMGPILKGLAQQDPNGAMRAAISQNRLIADSTAIWQAKKWIVSKLGEPLIHLNGMPRTTPQLEIIGFLRERGFDPAVVWFDLPFNVCLTRLGRPGRETEDTQESRMERLTIFKDRTLPMQEPMKSQFGISQANGNLLMLDNSNLQKHETGLAILDFLQLSTIPAERLFPEVFIGGNGSKSATRTATSP